MTRVIWISVIGLGLIMFAQMNAAIADSVSQYQLNAVYNCSIKYTEIEHMRWCRNEQDGFGFMYDGGQ